MDELSRRVNKLTSILDVAKAMTAERDLDSLLTLILREAAKVVEADRCSLFLVDRERGVLRTKIAHGMEAGKEIRLQIGVGIAGHVAETGEVLNLADAYDDPRFNRSVDHGTGYRTRAILCVPMRNTKNDIVGVLEALNKNAGSFTREDEELLSALGGQAAVAIENAVLHDEIQRLFEGFVKASVVAIESRDPSTAGHSDRVARLTLTLAEAVEYGARGPWAGFKFGAEQRREIRYAALLHDFGKVGVREPVLVKANKLYPHERDLLEQRFRYAKKSLEAASLKRRLDVLARGGSREEIDHEEDSLAAKLRELDEILEFLWACNRPSVLPRGGFERLYELRSHDFPGHNGGSEPLLTDTEISRLAIPKGSLSVDERLEIESHVSHTFRFLAQIPWGRTLQRVPEIAFGHHEKLDGKGYPRALQSDKISIEARMMTISDIFDALTASDRPYKKAVPYSTAVQILKDEVALGQLDAELFRLFIEAQVPQQALELIEGASAAASSGAVSSRLSARPRHGKTLL